MSNSMLLEGVSWSFIGDKIDSIEAFEKVCQEDGVSLPSGVLITASELQISYEFVDEEDVDHEKNFVLKPDNGGSFDAKELLFKIHNEVVEDLDENDYHFFEGLMQLEGFDKLTYDLLLGS